jgi:YD repeat-containing protein
MGAVDLLRRARNAVRRAAKRAALKRRSRIPPVKIVIGSASIAVRGWTLTDIEQLNVLDEHDWSAYFAPDSVDAILAEHVWEHLTAEEGARAAANCWRYLKAGARLRVAVPDGCHPDEQYREWVRPGGSGSGADDHKVLYTWRSLQELFEKAGFETRLLEYFDEQGRFHAQDWDPDDGMVRRSARYDERNRDGTLRYTSIIIDAVKSESTT